MCLANLKRRAKAKTVSLRAIIYGTLQGSERQKVWPKDLFLMTSSRARADQSRLALRTESTLSNSTHALYSTQLSAVCMVLLNSTLATQLTSHHSHRWPPIHRRPPPPHLPISRLIVAHRLPPPSAVRRRNPSPG
jgi:hypothetical protein